MGLFDIFKRKEEVIKADRLVIEDEEDAQTEPVEDVIEEDFDDPDKEAPGDRAENGPFDSEEHSGEGTFIDLGSLRIPAKQGLALRLEFEEKTKRVIAVGLDFEGSTLQVQAFAAPRSSGLWADVRSKLGEQVRKQGGSASKLDTELGTGLRTSVPVMQGSDQARVVHFYGVDGPRWFLRGVITGPATADEQQLATMVSLFRQVIVVRGDKPIPPRDLLPLTVPKAMAEQMAAAAAAQRQAQAQARAQAQAGSSPNGG